MKRTNLLACFLCAGVCLAQAAGEKSILTVKSYTPEEDARMLKLYEGLRVADVSDAMDVAGLPATGLTVLWGLR